MFARSAARSTLRQTFARRAYATGHHTSVTPPKSDLPWIIGSALIFTPLFFSLTSPPAVVKHITSPNKKEHQEAVPATLKATEAQSAEEQEPSPKDAAKAEEEQKPEEKQDEKVEEKAPAQENKDASNVEQGKDEDKEAAKPVGAAVADPEDKKEGSAEAKEGAKQKQPKQQEKVEGAIEESKEEEAKKDNN
ncbi:hypothetical protein JCM8097_008198 [Rhodosporidiobolus ruineniae]